MEPIQIGAKAAQDVVCANCQITVPGAQAHTFRGKKGEDIYICGGCKEKIDKEFQAETEHPNIVGSVFLGLLAGLIGGVVWYFVETLTGYQIGYLAIGVGWLIGQAVVFGAGKKRGQILQLISAAIALISIWAASYGSTMYYANQAWAKEAAAQGQAFEGPYFVLPFAPELLKAMISPMGLLIWGIGIYIAFNIPKSRKL